MAGGPDGLLHGHVLPQWLLAHLQLPVAQCRRGEFASARGHARTPPIPTPSWTPHL
uniref:Uncharacterized protein n=1 Tax=Anguilla anguilla TaxID=7936 RepID=A0A0E9V878_ANGAN